VYNKENGAYVVKNRRGGINWYRYQKKILEDKLLPFAKDCEVERPGIMVQEDNAPAHRSKYQLEVFCNWHVLRMEWCPNSPDINAIEPTWFWMKKETTKRGASTNRKKLRSRWEKCWKELSQKKIQEWIERIPNHIKEIIRLKGGNEYKEGRQKGQERIGTY
jgi:transposase